MLWKVRRLLPMLSGGRRIHSLPRADECTLGGIPQLSDSSRTLSCGLGLQVWQLSAGRVRESVLVNGHEGRPTSLRRGRYRRCAQV